MGPSTSEHQGRVMSAAKACNSGCRRTRSTQRWRFSDAHGQHRRGRSSCRSSIRRTSTDRLTRRLRVVRALFDRAADRRGVVARELERLGILDEIGDETSSCRSRSGLTGRTRALREHHPEKSIARGLIRASWRSSARPTTKRARDELVERAEALVFALRRMAESRRASRSDVATSSPWSGAPERAARAVPTDSPT